MCAPPCVRAFGITAISPTALTDALFFLACGVRMVRGIAASYGHRPTAATTVHLLRRLVVEAGKLGAVDIASASLVQHLGGAVAERFATTRGRRALRRLPHGAARRHRDGPVPADAVPRGRRAERDVRWSAMCSSSSAVPILRSSQSGERLPHSRHTPRSFPTGLQEPFTRPRIDLRDVNTGDCHDILSDAHGNYSCDAEPGFGAGKFIRSGACCADRAWRSVRHADLVRAASGCGVPVCSSARARRGAGGGRAERGVPRCLAAGRTLRGPFIRLDLAAGDRALQGLVGLPAPAPCRVGRGDRRGHRGFSRHAGRRL